jgi:hypothetical protein
MSKKLPTMFPDPESDAEAIDALEKAQELPPGKERTEALKKAGRLRNAADTYKHLFKGAEAAKLTAPKKKPQRIAPRPKVAGYHRAHPYARDVKLVRDELFLSPCSPATA